MMRNFALLTIALTIIAAPILCGAQEQQQPSLDTLIQQFRTEMRADRATIITQAMNFSDKDAAAFWPIYRKYEYERSRVDDGRVSVIKEYAQKYTAMSDADAKGMAERMFDCESRLVQLRKTYFKKFNKVLPAMTVAKFFQLEHRVDLLVDMKVESSLPALAGMQATAQQQ